MLEYCPCDQLYKSRIGGIKANEPLSIFIKGDGLNATLILTKEGVGHVPVHYAMNRVRGGFAVELCITTAGLYFYHFVVDGVNFGANDMLELTKDGCEFMQLVYDGEFRPLSGVIYQIMPDRFFADGAKIKANMDRIYNENWYAVPDFMPDTNGKYNNEFFGGNLKGIVQKLDYLKELGVTYIYLNPIFKAPSNHRYDTGDYESIDEDLGTESDFDELIAKAKERGIGIILDGVFSHTGADSKYFNRYANYNSLGAFQSRQSQYFSWYKFIDFPNVYKSWWGFETLPEVEETSPEYMTYILGENGIVDKWEKKGIAGWRLDVADELPDEFLAEFRKKSNVTVIGEVWENAARKFAYGFRRQYFLGKQLDGVTGYPLRTAIIEYITQGNNALLRKTVRELINDYPHETLISSMSLLGTHDTTRILTALSSDETPCDKAGKSKYVQSDIDQAIKRLKLASLIQYMLPGIPCLYYGDEAGVYGHEDPFCRKCYPWGRENRSLVNHYIMLGQIRKKYASVFCGSAIEHSFSEEVFVLTRSDGNISLTLTVNLSQDEIKVKNDILSNKRVLQFGEAAISEQSK